MTDDPAKPLSELLTPGSTLMVATASQRGELRSRPLTVARVSEDRIEILIDTTAEWTRTLSDGGTAFVTLSDTRANTWVSLVGTVAWTTDPAVIDELWNPFAGAYFDQGRDTPGIAVLYIDAQSGSYWSAPTGRLGSLFSMVKAKLGDAEQSGEHGKIRL